MGWFRLAVYNEEPVDTQLALRNMAIQPGEFSQDAGSAVTFWQSEYERTCEPAVENVAINALASTLVRNMIGSSVAYYGRHADTPEGIIGRESQRLSFFAYFGMSLLVRYLVEESGAKLLDGIGFKRMNTIIDLKADDAGMPVEPALLVTPSRCRTKLTPHAQDKVWFRGTSACLLIEHRSPADIRNSVKEYAEYQKIGIPRVMCALCPHIVRV